jgi:glycosyltransferase involved in cell wall biosynthesis
MKILRLTTFLDFGGQEKQYLSFTEKNELLHHQYIFAAIGYGGNAKKTLIERGFEVFLFNQNPAIRNLKNIFVLYRFFKKMKPDIVHTAAAEANFHGVIAARLAGVKKIYAEEIGLPNHSKIAMKIFNIVYRFTNGVICISQSVKKHLIEMGEINDKKGIVIYNPVSIPKKYDKKTSECFRLVYVGRLEKVKNVSLLIEAFAQLLHKNKIKLTLVGDGREKKYLEQSATDLGVGSQIEFTGFEAEPEKYVSQADLFVLPSLTEGFGIAVVEAMFQGIPCLCSKVGGIPEFIKDGKTGWLFDPNNLQELVYKIEKIYQLPKNQLIEIGEQGKKHALSRFSNQIYIQQLEKIYEQN